jgi:hypothetical protein
MNRMLLLVPVPVVVVGLCGICWGYVNIVEIAPADPTSRDILTVHVSGSLPDTCWSYVDHQVQFSGNEISIDVALHREPGGCFLMLGSYRFESELGNLQAGSYTLTVTDAQDSKTLEFTVRGEESEELFIRGDCNDNGSVEIADAICMICYLLFFDCFYPCLDAVDANDDGSRDISDPIYLLVSLFLGGNAPPAPFPECGPDPTPDFLDCGSYRSCQ